jgi:hypothetical protein
MPPNVSHVKPSSCYKDDTLQNGFLGPCLIGCFARLVSHVSSRLVVRQPFLELGKNVLCISSLEAENGIQLS